MTSNGNKNLSLPPKLNQKPRYCDNFPVQGEKKTSNEIEMLSQESEFKMEIASQESGVSKMEYSSQESTTSIMDYSNWSEDNSSQLQLREREKVLMLRQEEVEKRERALLAHEQLLSEREEASREEEDLLMFLMLRKKPKRLKQ